MNTIEANQKLHASEANTYKRTQPHYRPENKRKIDKILRKLEKQTGGFRLIDFGCGQGFIIDLAEKYFSKITGVDVCKEMTDKINVSKHKHSNVNIINSPIDCIPVGNESYDVCTAYAALHHFSNLYDVFKEAYRILKDGGIFWSGLDPSSDSGS